MTDIIPPDEQHYSPARVAQMFDVTIETVHNWRKKGLLEGVRIQGRWRIKRQSVIDLANSQYGSKQQ